MPIAYCLLPVAYCLLPITYCLLPIASCLLPIAYCLLPIAYCLLLVAYGLLPFACRLLPIAYCLLPIAYCLWPIHPAELPGSDCKFDIAAQPGCSSCRSPCYVSKGNPFRALPSLSAAICSYLQLSALIGYLSATTCMQFVACISNVM